MRKINPFISVIIPVYNTEKRLEKCIDSILTQTYAYFELLLVNDGSKDSSGEICDAYIKRDNRIKVLHKENGGASSARNLGIEYSNGEYICFVDSDDYVDNDYLSAFLVDALKVDEKTFIIQNLQIENDGVIKKFPEFHDGLYKEKDFSKLFSVNEIDRRCGPMCKLYNREILVKYNLKFNPKIHAGEDLLFLITYLSYIKNVYLSSEFNYHAVSSEGSLSKRYNSFESELLTFQLLNNAYKKLDNVFNLDDSAKNRIRKNSLSLFFMRPLTTIYRQDSKKTRKERLAILNELHSKDNLILFDMKSKDGIKIIRIGYFIYEKKLFALFDFYYSLVYSLRYKFNKQWQIYLKAKIRTFTWLLL